MSIDIKEVRSILGTNPTYTGLPAEELESLTRSLSVERFASKETIFSEGGAASCAWIVLSGRVKIMVYISEERMIQTESVEKGRIFGLFCRLGGKRETYPCTAIADKTVTAVRIPDDRFDELCRDYSSMSRECFSLCAKRLNAMQRLIAFVRENSDIRIAETLLAFQAVHGARVPATRHTLSLQTGMAIETVFRVLSVFRKKGWVRTGRGFIDIRKPRALKDLIEGSKNF